MKLSVIICAYTLDRWSMLSEAVESCFSQTLAPDEVILVTDYNEELYERATSEFSKVRVVANVMTKGLSGARNSGVMVSSGDVVAFLDDDAHGDHQWLEKLTEPFSDPLVVGTGGWILPQWEAGEPRWFPRTFLWVVGCSYEGLPAHGASIRNPIGASMAMRRDIFTRVGGFSAGLGRIGTTPLGCEETELCIRYGELRPEESFVLVRDSIVHHRVPPSRCTWRYFFRRCWAEGLSKAAVASLVGQDAGLSAERRHVALAIPREIIDSVRDLTLQPLALFGRVFCLLGGSLTAAAGYLRGTRAVRKNPVSLKSAELPGVSESIVPSRSNTWRPITIVQLDIDAVPDEITVPEDANARIWLEILRRGQVVGRQEFVSQNGRILRSELEDIVEQFAASATSFIEVSDEDLPSISIVVPTICRFPEELQRFVGSLASLDYPNFEVVIVDNRVTPEWNMPPMDMFENVKVVAERIPGISAARNRGIRVATHDIVAFTDDDVVVDARWLRAIGGRFYNNPEISALGGLVLPAHLTTPAQLWFEEYFGGFSQSFDLHIVNEDHHPDDPLFPYAAGRYAAGCNMAFRRSVLLDMGGFRLTLGTGTPAFGGEDLESFVTIASRGATIAFEPAALVRHSHRPTEELFLAQARGYGAGLTAMYTSLVLHHPSHVLRMARHAWQGVRGLDSTRTQRSISREPSFPSETKRMERRGIVYGPAAYARSWMMFNRKKKQIFEEFGDWVRI